MKLYHFVNSKGQKTTINTDLLIAYYINDLVMTVKLTEHELTIQYENEKARDDSYNHLDSFMKHNYK